MLPYKLLSVDHYDEQGWDGILVVANKNAVDSLPDKIKNVINAASNVDESIHNGVSVLPTSLPSRRLIYSSVGTLDPEFHDVRSFSEAAVNGVKRAVKAGAKNVVLILMKFDGYPQAMLVTLLGVMEALYQPLQLREARCSNEFKMNKIGLWCEEQMNIEELIKIATALECGRVVARDIGGSDPERMAPPKIEEYIHNTFLPLTGISVEVIKDEKVFVKDYPLFAAVNRAAHRVDRHRGRIIYLKYSGSTPKETLLLVGKGVTYDTGGADLKVGGNMAGMSRDKCGAAAVAGFLKTVSILEPKNLRVIGALALVRNSIGEDSYVADEIITSRSGKLVRIGNTDAEGRMIMADVLTYMKEVALSLSSNCHLMTIATLTGHAYLTVGPGYTIALDNGTAKKSEFSRKIQRAGERMGDMIEISTIRREDYSFIKGKNEGEDLVQANNKPSSQTPRGHQFPAAFLISVSGLDEHSLTSEQPLKYTHLDIAASAGDVPNIATGSPILALSSQFLNISY